MKKRSKKNQPLISIKKVDSSFAEEMLRSIEEFSQRYNNGAQIVTFLSEPRGWQQQVDVQREKDSYRWGYQESYKLILTAKLVNPGTYPLSIVVRTFSDETVEMITEGVKVVEIPKKEIRMFFLPSFGECHQLSSEDVFACMNTHAETGEVLPLDPSLEYCGEG